MRCDRGVFPDDRRTGRIRCQHLLPRTRLLCLLLIAGLPAASPLVGQSPGYEEMQRLSGVLNHIRLNYADEVDFSDVIAGAIDGALRSLDPHSAFLSRAQWLELNALERGELASVGIQLESVDGAMVVRAVLDDGPAQTAGIMPGDRLLTIDGRTIEGLTPNEVELRLAGAPGSRVRLRAERGFRADPAPYELSIERAFLTQRSVTHSTLLDEATGYVQLGQFLEDAGEELAERIRQQRRQGAVRLVLDLRGNPGGSVVAAGEAAEHFLPRNTLVFEGRGRKADANLVYRTGRAGKFRSMPVVVLVDEHTASAAEALAASLQDHDRAVIVGRRTFGKALMQSAFVLATGDVVLLTIGHLESPSGRVIQRPYRGLRLEEYHQGATAAQGDAGPDLPLFRTAGGRLVHGGGGVHPDVPLAARVGLPVWWTLAQERGIVSALTDSVGIALRSNDEGAWYEDAAARQARLVEPFLTRVNQEMNASFQPSDDAADEIGRRLATRMLEVANGPDVARDFRLRFDPDVIAALRTFPESELILNPHSAGADGAR